MTKKTASSTPTEKKQADTKAPVEDSLFSKKPTKTFTTESAVKESKKASPPIDKVSIVEFKKSYGGKLGKTDTLYLDTLIRKNLIDASAKTNEGWRSYFIKALGINLDKSI